MAKKRIRRTTIPAANGNRMLVPKGKRFRLRMYRQGLGDCFLLALPTDNDSEPFYMLIDCGVILGTSDAPAIMQRVAKSIADSTGNRIDVLVATHEHWDHLSGFLQAKDIFKDIQIEKLWLAWTEDPADTLANELRGLKAKTIFQLRSAMPRFAAADKSGQPGDRLGARVSSLLDFFGATAMGGGGDDTGTALNWVREHADSIDYRRPGEAPIVLPDVGKSRVFVLGPPHDKVKIKHSDASASEKSGGTVYHLTRQQGADAAFFAAAAEHDTTDSSIEETLQNGQPFDPVYRLTPESVGRNKADRPSWANQTPRPFAYAKPDPTSSATKLFRGYFRESTSQWRRIDADWLEVGAELALKLDSDTNNTSLVLAVELSDRNVLLFAADAQVGNWTSWAGYTWKVDDAGQERAVTAADLLGRTLVYKVGHHASHNATLRKGGLEAMGRNMVAMVPVHHAMAVKKRWNMPFPKLLSALKERARGRVMRVDTGLPTDADRPTTLSAAEWKAFKQSVVETKDYLEYAS